MFDDPQREEELFGKLSNRSPDYIAGDLVKDVDAAIGFINSRYCADHEFAAAAQKYQLIIKALSTDGDSAAVRRARAEVQITLLVTLIASGDYNAARALAQDPDLNQGVKRLEGHPPSLSQRSGEPRTGNGRLQPLLPTAP